MAHTELELLMPAGSRNKMNLALEYGADAVYLGPPLFSLRARENHFGPEELEQSIAEVHQRGKKVYMTLNIFARNRKLKSFSEAVTAYAKMKPDAFIMSDPGLASMARELAPEIPIHLSVQANCMNWQSVKFWKRSLGVERVILSRELSIAEITEIKQRVPDIELEAFVHGSICIAYSGRCLLSSYMDKRDANQGVCDNSCREKYKIHQKEFYIEDVNSNPGELYEIDEDEHGTYILNAKDLCMIEHLDKLTEAGVISFKVEGRTKSEFYAAMVARSYRGALDDVMNKRPYNKLWMEELFKLTHRGYHTAFMLEDPGASAQNYKTSTQYQETVKFLGYNEPRSSASLMSATSVPGSVRISVKNKIEVGQEVEVVLPGGHLGVQEGAEAIRTRILEITTDNGESKQQLHSGSGYANCRLASDQVFAKYAMMISLPVKTILATAEAGLRTSSGLSTHSS